MSDGTSSGSNAPKTPMTEAERRARRREMSRYRSPKRPPIPFKTGWKALPGKVKAVYIIVILFSAAYLIMNFPALGPAVNLGIYFNAATMNVNTILFMLITFAIQVVLIYMDITERSVSKVKVFIPLVYFAAVMYLLSDLIKAATAV